MIKVVEVRASTLTQVISYTETTLVAAKRTHSLVIVSTWFRSRRQMPFYAYMQFLCQATGGNNPIDLSTCELSIIPLYKHYIYNPSKHHDNPSRMVRWVVSSFNCWSHTETNGGPAPRLFAHEGAAAKMSPSGLMVSDLTMTSPWHTMTTQ